VTFVGLGVQQAPAGFLAANDIDTAVVQSVMSILLDMAADASVSAGSPADQLAVGNAIQASLRATLDAMSAQGFVEVALTMLQSQNTKVRLFSTSLM
jgi:hypothetical protein